MRQPHRQWLIVLFVAAGILFCFPLITLWDQDIMVFGLPLLPLGLFTVWALVIFALAWIMERLER